METNIPFEECRLALFGGITEEMKRCREDWRLPMVDSTVLGGARLKSCRVEL